MLERKKCDDYARNLEIQLGLRKPVRPAIEIMQVPELEGVEGVRSVYELTLTMVKDDHVELLKWFDKIRKSKMFDVKAFKACIELQENGNPHLHACLWSGKKHLNRNHVKDKIKFPNRFSLEMVRNQPKFYEYILKAQTKNIDKDIDYCKQHNIPQTWSSKLEENIIVNALTPP